AVALIPAALAVTALSPGPSVPSREHHRSTSRRCRPSMIASKKPQSSPSLWPAQGVGGEVQNRHDDDGISQEEDPIVEPVAQLGSTNGFNATRSDDCPGNRPST